jgi:hypothetical protein
MPGHGFFSKLRTIGIEVKPGGSDNVLEPDIRDPHPYVPESELKILILQRAEKYRIKPLTFFNEKTHAHMERHYGTYPIP